MDYKNYKIIKTEKELDRLIKYCKKTKYASVDFETNALPFHSSLGYPTILGVSFQPGSAWIIPLGHFDSPFKDDYVRILKKFGREVIENPNIVKIAQNLKFEQKWFKKYGIEMLGRLFDTMLAKYLLDEERPHGLKEQVNRFLPQYGGYEEYEGSNLPWDQKPLEGLSQYCGLDCDMTFRLMIFYERKLIDNKFYSLFRNMMMMGSRVLCESEFEGMNIDVKYLQELVINKKIAIDDNLDKLKNHSKLLTFDAYRLKEVRKKMVNDLQEEIASIRNLIDDKLQECGEDNQTEYFKFKNQKERTIKNREEKISKYIAGEFTTKKDREAMEPFNFNSTNQLRELLFTSKKGFRFDIIKYTSDKKTKQETDKPSTDSEVLEHLKTIDKSGFILQLMEHRGMIKLYTTYMVGMLERLSEDGRIHGSFLLHGTVTGRLSSREPNLQNIPRDTTSSEIKTMFIPPKGSLMMQLDYSQAELRVLAAQAKETAMLDAFNANKDIHTATACKKYNADYDEVDKILNDNKHPEFKTWKVRRKQAKTINFGIVYGQGPTLLATSLSEPEEGIIVTKEEAQKFLDDFAYDFPKIAKHIKKQHKLVHRDAFVRNIFGRKRRLPNIDSNKYMEVAEAERQSVNAPIQGAASDFTLFSSVLIRNAKINGDLPKSLTQVATVHDSLIFYIKPKDLHKVIPKLYKICRNPQTMRWFGFQITSVEMKVDFEVGENWGALKDYDSDRDYTELLS
tara:strand:+ start:7879 stop:10083 length:2205 start_codon:yes stop_codon:yes gene_type:complete